MTHRPYTTRAKQALELANTAASTLGHEYIGTEHILIGLLDEQSGPAAQILTKFGVTTGVCERNSAGRASLHVPDYFGGGTPSRAGRDLRLVPPAA